MKPMISTIAALCVLSAAPAEAQNGLSDDRVSLPDGPGSIGGVGENVDVNPNMGSSSFRVPLRVPQGANAQMSPSLALSYASGRGMGNLGIGWELASPSIERTVNRGLPTYTTDDAFAADGGTELSFVATVSGDRVYRARFEGDFVRYTWRAVGAGRAGYWTAELPDGRVGYYGADADGTLVASARVQADTGETFRYHLVEMVDPVGRRMVQRFTKDSGWVLLDEIQYAFGGMAAPRFSVRFGYEDRPDVLSDATPGYEIQLTKRVSEVRVVSEAATIRRYTLGYEPEAQSGGLSRLARVTEFGRDGGQLEIEHTFAYSRTLGGACAVGCEQPFMVDMGTLPGGVNIQSGLAALIDINGDSLPDVLESSATGEHRFHISELATDGRPSFTGAAVMSSETVGGSSFVPSNPRVQLLDVNGDGFTDIVDQVNGTVLCNTGEGDWSGTMCALDPSALPTLTDDSDADREPEGMRFFDYDNDKRIDLLRTPDVGTTLVSRNTGSAYEAVTVDALGVAFDADNLQLSDMNGDGLQDVVQLVGSGASSTVRTRLHLGFGVWADAVDVVLSDLPDAQLDSAVLEDLDGNGLSDVVVVTGTEVAFWLNRGDNTFDARASLSSADVDGAIPVRTATETVLFADMNGNGTDDVVWVSSSGQVRFLELFPVRPNLLSRVENGIGWVREIEYGTSVAERARDEGTASAWVNPLPSSMNVVKATDTWVTVSGGEGGAGIHERRELDYHGGFYDGVEKAFRGFAAVDRRLVADPTEDGQEPGLEQLFFDVGRNDPARHGNLLRRVSLGGPSADVPLSETRMEHSECSVDGVASADVTFICETATTVIHMEGAPAAEWATVRSERDYDGYGNVVEERSLGVVNMNAPEAAAACGACDAPAGLNSGACGADCTGDEQTTRTRYVVSGAATGDAWLLNLAVAQTVVEPGGEDQVTRTFYDGPEFVGLAAGQADRGLVTRVTRDVSATESVDVTRSAYDGAGNLVAVLAPNGDPVDPSVQRRDFTYDARGLRVTQVTIRAGDYDLVQEVSYESSFLLASEATDFYAVRAGAELTSRNGSSFRYDEHGRVITIIRPGDTDAAPTESFSYELGDPVSRVVARGRRTAGGPMDVETVLCQDGRGRQLQTRKRVGDGAYQIDGFTERNSRGKDVRVYQAYASSSADCEMSAPSGVAFNQLRYDALDRLVSTLRPDESIHGSASEARVEFGPLETRSFDANDSDAASPHADTPSVTRRDGLERTVRIERLLSPSEAATYRLFYDGVGNVARVEDPAGDARVQEFDRAARVVRTVDPNAGETRFVRDAAGNVLRSTDARGVAVVSAYDALDRLIERHDDDDMMGTLERTVYDFVEGCTDCRNGAGRVVRTEYPLPGFAEGGSDEVGYDPRGRRVLLRRTLEGNVFETGFVWDGTGSLVSATYPDGRTLEYGYDEASRPTSLGGVIASASYTERGRLGTLAHANGVTGTFGYDALVRPESVSFAGAAGTFLDVTVSRDREGNVLEATDGGGGGVSHAARYGYDAWYRLTEATLEPGAASEEVVAFEYDLLDNLTSRTSSAGMASAAHLGQLMYGEGGAGPNAATTIGGTSYSYDAAGQVTGRGAMQLDWDHAGRLMEAMPGGRPSTQMAYAPSGDRVIKLEDGGVTYYPAPDFIVRDGIASLYPRFGDLRVARLRTDMGAEVLADSDGDGSIGVGDAWAARSGDVASRVRLLRASARRLLHDATDAETHLHGDLRRSLVAATDSGGAVVAERSFHAFGLERASTGFVDEHGFTGQEMDGSTGLLHFRFRYLDPRAGRWTQVDPAFGVLDGSNMATLGESTTGYAYVANNPVNVIDPDGLLGKKIRSLGKGIRNRVNRATSATLGSNKRTGRKLGASSRTDDASSALGAAQSARDRAGAARRELDGPFREVSRGRFELPERVRNTPQERATADAALEAADRNVSTAEQGLRDAQQEDRRFQGKIDNAAGAFRENTPKLVGLAVGAGLLLGIGIPAALSLNSEPGNDDAPVGIF